MRPLILIDWSWLVFRNHWARLQETDEKGRKLGGFKSTYSMMGYIRKLFPAHAADILCVLDGPFSLDERQDHAPTYKAHREETQEREDAFRFDEELQALVNHDYQVEFMINDYTEADDLLYHVAVTQGDKGRPVIVYTADSDAYSLIGYGASENGVVVSKKLKGGEFEEIVYPNGCPRGHIIWKALKGKTSDNVPSVPYLKTEDAKNIIGYYLRRAPAGAAPKRVAEEMLNDMADPSSETPFPKCLTNVVSIPVVQKLNTYFKQVYESLKVSLPIEPEIKDTRLKTFEDADIQAIDREFSPELADSIF